MLLCVVNMTKGGGKLLLILGVSGFILFTLLFAFIFFVVFVVTILPRQQKQDKESPPPNVLVPR